MAHTRNVSAIRKSGKTLKVKAGKNRGITTPLGRKRICLESIRDSDPEACCTSECNCSCQENCLDCPLTLQPPLACMNRGAQGMDGWWNKSDSIEVLGHMKECMQSFAQHCLKCVQDTTTVLHVLSLSDGSLNHCEQVPTSVLLAHAFASLDIHSLPDGLECIKIVGGDYENPHSVCQHDSLLPPWRSPWMPPWLELQHVCLDNKKGLTSQLYKSGLGGKYDVVLMRQGLCYCDDHSFDCWPAQRVNIVGVSGESRYDKPSGTYVMEADPINGRPSYRKGSFLLYWYHHKSPHRSAWVIARDDYKDAGSPVVAKVCKDAGSPALAQAPWYVWDGRDFVRDMSVSCDVVGSCPWRRPPHACKCCAGISLHASAMQSFIGRVATVLDEHNPRAFAFLQSGFYTGIANEVEEFQLELEKAAEQFNSSKSTIRASVLRRQESQDIEYDETTYWNKIDGLLLFPASQMSYES